MTSGREDRPEDVAGRRRSIFVSYTHADRPKAKPVVDALAKEGFDVWWDRMVAGGATFADETERALESAEVVLVLWSANSIHSHWVRDEATRGRDRRCLVPVSLDGCEPPLGFRQLQYLDLSHWRGNPRAPQFRELLSAIERCGTAGWDDLGYAGTPPKARALDRRTVLAAGGVGILLAGGLAAWQSGLFAPAPSTNSVAVMPFRNLSGSTDQAYFSDGLAEELRATLSLNRQLEVAAGASSDMFHASNESAPDIAGKLGVAFLVEGSVRRSADMLRITAQLIDGTSGFEAWSEIFERPAEDVIAVQREIAATVADALTSTISGSDDGAGERIGGTSNAQALDAYLKGVALYALAESEESDRQALEAFNQAIALDPEYAAAHAARSRALTVVGSSYGTGKELQAYYTQAMEAARKAIELAPDMAEGYAALGLVLVNGRQDLAAAREPYQRSFDLGYGNATILRGFADFATHTGQFDQAREALARAKKLDPLNFLVFRSAALLEFSDRDYAAAASEVRSALAQSPDGGGLHRILGDIALVDGNFTEARRQFLLEPSAISRLRGLAIADAQLSGRAAGEAHLAELVDTYGRNSLYQQAEIYAQWGMEEKAIEALQQCVQAADSGLILALNDPLLDPIRQDSRFRGILRRLGLEAS